MADLIFEAPAQSRCLRGGSRRFHIYNIPGDRLAGKAALPALSAPCYLTPSNPIKPVPGRYLSMKSTWVLVANPTAGGGRAGAQADLARRLLAAAGRPVEVCLTDHRGHAASLARQAVAGGAAGLIVMGGDGTLAETLPALAGSQTVLGLLPSGTGNDLARSLGIPRRLHQAVAVLLEGRVRALDLGICGDNLFATVATLGLDAEISEAMIEGRIPLKGTPGYLFEALRRLPSYCAPTLRVQGDFGLFEGPFLLVAVANTASYGGGLKIAPQADPHDGLLDVCLVDPLPLPTALSLLPRLFWGGHAGHPAVRFVRSAALEITGPTPRLSCADGELQGRTPLAFGTRPAAVQVILPP